MSGQRMAGSGLIEWAMTPVGEEVLEGIGGGVLAGAPLFFQDNHPGQAALSLATAIAGGIGMGMMGRRIGRHVGASIQPGALADQQGMPATFGRVLGQETIGDAVSEQGKMFKSQVADYLVNEQVTKMKLDGIVNASDLDKLLVARKLNGLNDVFKNAPDEVKAGLMKALDEDIARLRPVEEQLVNGAVDTMEEKIQRLVKEAESMEASGEQIPSSLLQVVKGLGSGDAKPVTGAEVGRAVGRVLGDEIGVLGGLGVGALVCQQMGLQTPKDREIERLKQQLQGGPSAGWW